MRKIKIGKLKQLVNDIRSNPNFDRATGVLQDLIDGNILVRKYFRRQYPLLFIIACFLILYIGNRYTCDKNMRHHRELVKEIVDLRYELLSISAQLTEKSRGSVIEDSVRSQIPRLHVSRVPSIIIK